MTALRRAEDARAAADLAAAEARNRHDHAAVAAAAARLEIIETAYLEPVDLAVSLGVPEPVIDALTPSDN